MLYEAKTDKCPHASCKSVYDAKRYKTYESPDFCDINDKPCPLESGLECDTWNEIQTEWREEVIRDGKMED